jgi:hypothetical protein
MNGFFFKDDFLFEDECLFLKDDRGDFLSFMAQGR